MKCRFDGLPIDAVILDLGSQPLANSLADSQEQALAATRYPLRILFNPRNGLVQTDFDIDPATIFHQEYPYYSSTSRLWLSHVEKCVEDLILRFVLTPSSKVLEIGSNDGYMLQYFGKHSIPCWGVEPVSKLAAASRAKGVVTINEPFSLSFAAKIQEQCGSFDLIVANNVLAHMPDLPGSLKAIRSLLAPSGTAVVEVPHLIPMLEDGAFDAVYHEHFFYFSLSALERCGEVCGLAVVDVEKISTHGGSLRVYLRDSEVGIAEQSSGVKLLRDDEERLGKDPYTVLHTLQVRADRTKESLHDLIAREVLQGKTVTAYPASAKGTVLLNYCELGSSHITAVADKAIAKQGRFIPGVGVPIVDIPSMLATSPDYILILARNILSELTAEIQANSDWRGKLIVAYPDLRIFDIEER